MQVLNILAYFKSEALSYAVYVPLNYNKCTEFCFVCPSVIPCVRRTGLASRSKARVNFIIIMNLLSRY